ncbi:hypothetical protein NE235_07875 [Actinoallomurus spadix]|uniref:Uncharacterized protein n=1 Tax=Actinoallomurus spadix TaxID=79912 RepID=A0ABP3GSZ9_9ACTN|nr:hypothetical protein [Actinoallomurus spadix]MCO5986023.1 hypothetical protein [Actinoallomurus spadix]
MLEQLDQPAWAHTPGASGPASQIPDLLGRLARADKTGSVAIIHAILDHIWVDGEVFPATVTTIPFLRELLGLPPNWLHPKLLLILGVLAEGHAKDVATTEAVRAAVGDSVDPYLALAPAAQDDWPALALSLGYLLAHFPAHRARIEAALDGTSLRSADRARITRCLTIPDFSVPATMAAVSRSWPSPEIWAGRPGEDEIDREWKESFGIGPEQAARIWDLETESILTYLGAHAEYAVFEESGVE